MILQTFISASSLNLFLSLADLKSKSSFLIPLWSYYFCKINASFISTNLYSIFSTMYIKLFLATLSNLEALLTIHLTQEGILTYFFICLYVLFLKATEYKLTLYACQWNMLQENAFFASWKHKRKQCKIFRKKNLRIMKSSWGFELISWKCIQQTTYLHSRMQQKIHC